jgi:MFS family permease
MMLGPALAAGVLVLGGASLLLAFTAALFAISAVLVARIGVVAAPPAETGGSLVADARASLRMMTRDRVLRVMVFGTGVIVLAAGMMNVAEVLLAQHDLRVGGAGFAAMVAVFGIGSVLGSTASARSTSLGRLKAGYLAGHAVLGAGMVGSALSGSLAVAMATFFITGFGQAASMTHNRGLLQHLVPGEMLARAHALIGTIEAWGFAGAALVGGTLASLLGARAVFAISGVALIALSAIAAVAMQRPAPQLELRGALMPRSSN